MLNHFKRKVDTFLFKKKWRKKNSHNTTWPVGIFRIDAVNVGKGTYGNIQILHFNDNTKMCIGNYCSIAPNVLFILSADHYTNRISTFPFQNKCIDNSILEGVSKGDIIVDDDVWLGYGATIMSGVHIGQGAVIAAGAVVTKDVPPYAIVGGVPANIIKYRFPPHIIEALLEVDYGKLTKEMVENHIDELYVELTDVSQVEWMPKKER